MFSHFEKNYPEKIFIKKENTQGVYFPRVFWRFFPSKKKLATRKPKKKKNKKPQLFSHFEKPFSQKKNFIKKKKKNTE
jgi:hypothetical protein